jgi:hypothetical protein
MLVVDEMQKHGGHMGGLLLRRFGDSADAELACELLPARSARGRRATPSATDRWRTGERIVAWLLHKFPASSLDPF